MIASQNGSWNINSICPGPGLCIVVPALWLITLYRHFGDERTDVIRRPRKRRHRCPLKQQLVKDDATVDYHLIHPAIMDGFSFSPLFSLGGRETSLEWRNNRLSSCRFLFWNLRWISGKNRGSGFHEQGINFLMKLVSTERIIIPIYSYHSENRGSYNSQMKCSVAFIWFSKESISTVAGLWESVRHAMAFDWYNQNSRINIYCYDSLISFSLTISDFEIKWNYWNNWKFHFSQQITNEKFGSLDYWIFSNDTNV